eukprot:scaffold77845_cov46-Prasinocladus_malaysianus.AAC.1
MRNNRVKKLLKLANAQQAFMAASVAVDYNNAVRESEADDDDDHRPSDGASSPRKISNQRGTVTGIGNARKGAALNRPRISLLLEEYTAAFKRPANDFENDAQLGEASPAGRTSLGLATLTKQHSDKDFLMQSMRSVPVSEQDYGPSLAEINRPSSAASSGKSSLDFAGSEGPRPSIGDI